MSQIWSVLRMFALALSGGTVFFAAGLPAPWLAGAMIVAAGASLCGMRTQFPDWLRSVVFMALGLQIGASFTWESLANFIKWPLSLGILGLTLLALMFSGMFFYQRVFGWSRSTAFFSSAPGALSMTFALAQDRNADLPAIAVVQCMRLFLLVALLPLAVSLTGLGVAGLPASALAAGWRDVAVMLAMGVPAGFLANWLKVPAGFLLGAMAGNAVAHLSGAATGAVPIWLLIPAFTLLGIMVGIRFQEIAVSQLKRMFSAGLAGFCVSLVIAAGGALLASTATGIPLLVTLLAFAPGGLEVMTILAFALGLNPAFVAVHQVARYLGLSLIYPGLTAFVHRSSA